MKTRRVASRPHGTQGTDKEGTLFAEFFLRLNSSGLFGDVATAQAFLDYYLSFDWTETGDYTIAEVWVPDDAA